MNEIASYVPTTTWRYRLGGIVAIALPLTGAIASAVANEPYTAPVVVLAVVAFFMIGAVLASTTSRFVVSVDDRALYIDEHRWITKTKRSVIPLVGLTRPELVVGPSSFVLRADSESVVLSDVPAEALGVLAQRLESLLGTWTRAPISHTESPEAKRFEQTRWLVMGLIQLDERSVREALSAGADPNGHPDAGGRGAPLRIARLLELPVAEALLVERGATPLDAAVDPREWGLVIVVATTMGSANVARRLQAPLP